MEEDLRADLEVAVQHIHELEERLRLAGSDRAEVAEQRVRDLEAQNDRLLQENDRGRDALEALQTRLDRTDRAAREHARERDDSADAVARLKQQLDRVTDELQRERSRATDLAAAGSRVARDRSANNVELDKAVAEADALREEVKELQEELRAHQDAVSHLKGEVEDHGDTQSELQRALAEAGRHMQELANELQAANATAAQAHELAEQRVGMLREADARAGDVSRRHASELRAADERTAAVEHARAALAAELKAVKDQSRVRELEDEAAGLRAELGALAAQREELSSLLEAHNAHLGAAAAETQDLRDRHESSVLDAVGSERRRLADAQRAIEDLNAQLRDERAKYEELVSDKAEVEAGSERLQQRLTRLEAGYGLAEAAAEIELLHDAILRRDADIARLSQSAGTQLDMHDALLEIAQRLAERCGLGQNVDVWAIYPSDEIRVAVDSALERLRASNAELQRQNDALEEQRTRLLHSLRVQAEQTGSKSLKYFGLSAEQMMLVNEYAENIRDGRPDLLPVTDRSAELQRQLAAAQAEARDFQLQLARASSAGGSAGGGGGALNAETIQAAITRAVAAAHASIAPPLAADAAATAAAAASAAAGSAHDQQRIHAALTEQLGGMTSAWQDALKNVVEENRS